MAAPTNMRMTPQATTTVADGFSTDASSEFWQRVAGNVFKVYTNVPNALCQNLYNSRDPDTAIANQLVGYPYRVASV